MNALQKLRQLVSEIELANTPADAPAAWGLAGRLLSRMPVDQAHIAQTITNQNFPELDAIVCGLENPKSTQTPAPASHTPDISKKDMTAAMKAFRKRLKLSRLADESKLGGRQMTSGRASEIDAIIPPHEYPQLVWDALAKEGKLKHTGQGFYSL